MEETRDQYWAGVFGYAPNDVWILGQDTKTRASFFRHWNGAGFTESQPLPMGGPRFWGIPGVGTIATGYAGAIWLQLYLGTGELERARECAARAVVLSDESPAALRNLAISYLLQHRLEEARATFRRQRHTNNGNLYRLMGEALVEQEMGHEAEARRLADELSKAPFAVGANYQVAEAYAWQGRADEAFIWLEQSRKNYDGGLAYLKYDPLLRKIRGDPRYTALLRKMNLPVD